MYSSSGGAPTRLLALAVLAALLPAVSTEVAAVEASAPLLHVAVEHSVKGLCLSQVGTPTVTKAGSQHRSDTVDAMEAADLSSQDHGTNVEATRTKGDFHPIGPFAALAQTAVKVTTIMHHEEPEAMLPTFILAIVLCLMVAVATVVGPETFRYNRIEHILYRYFAAGGEYQPLRGQSGPARTKIQVPIEVGSAGNLLEDNSYLCSELVVPEDCECSLVIPARPLWQGPLEVTDLDGGTVLLQVISNDEAWVRLLLNGGEVGGQDPVVPEAARMERLLTLLTPQGSVLTYCCANSGPGQPLEIAMLRAGEGQPFATLAIAGRHEYVISTKAGKTFRFIPGSSMACRFDILDEGNRKCATSRMLTSEFDARGECYCAQTAPLTDVGLLLCGMLCACNVLEQNIA